MKQSVIIKYQCRINRVSSYPRWGSIIERVTSECAGFFETRRSIWHKI